MNRYLLFLFILISALPGNAQIAGYLGKRAVVSYNNYFFFGLKGPGSLSGGSSNEFSPAFNSVHCLNFDYVTHPRIAWVLSGQYFRTGVAYRKGSANGFYSGYDEYPYPGQLRYAGDFGTPMLLSSVNVGLGVKFFGKGYLAPLGKYQKFELLILFETLTYENKKFVMQEYDYPYSDIPVVAGTGKYNYRNFSLAYTLGRQKVLSDKFVLDYGMRFGLTPVIVPNFMFLSDNARTMESRLNSDSRNRIFRHQLINFHLGIGFLAF